jgi:putative two-component system protein, hydrogenase maturation factor HypX/HoxX
MVPESIWARQRCLIVHPGSLGDRGPSSLDLAIELGIRSWGVTLLEANAEPDAGEVWARADSSCATRERAACTATRSAGPRPRPSGRRSTVCSAAPAPCRRSGPAFVSGRARPLTTEDVRAIDWRADHPDVIRKLRAAEGHPGVRDTVQGIEALFELQQIQLPAR